MPEDKGGGGEQDTSILQTTATHKHFEILQTTAAHKHFDRYESTTGTCEELVSDANPSKPHTSGTALYMCMFVGQTILP